MRLGDSIGEYLLEARVSGAKTKSVWRARRFRDDKQFTLRIFPALGADVTFLSQFLRFREKGPRLEHPCLVPLEDGFPAIGDPEESFCTVSPWIEGVSVEYRLRSGPLPVREAVAIVRGVLDALDHVHSKGLLHGDLRPSAIVLNRNGEAFLTNAWLGSFVEQTRRERAGMHRMPLYLSPEQVHDAKEANIRSEVYSVGCILYEVLTGRPPFLSMDDDDPGDSAIRRAHLAEVPAPLNRWNKEVPPSLETVVMNALAKNPDLRIPNCAAFGHALSFWLRRSTQTAAQA